MKTNVITADLRTRTELREQLVGWTVATITDLFEAEGLTPTPLDRELGGARRSLAAEYLNSIDWADDAGKRRFLRVAEQVIDQSERTTSYGSDQDQLLKLLQRDGYFRDPDGNLRPRAEGILLDLPTSALVDSTAIGLEVQRIVRDWDQDANQVVDGAKRLVEATCKRILSDRGVDAGLGSSPALTALVARTLEELDLRPQQLDGDRWGDDVEAASKRVLGSLAAIADGLATLRNRVGGHGHTSARKLPNRWGHLAAGAASTLCRMLLETHEQRPATPHSGDT